MENSLDYIGNADYCPTCHNPLGRENAGEGLHPVINILMLIILTIGFIIIFSIGFKHKLEKGIGKKLVKRCFIYIILILCIQILINLGLYHSQHGI